MSNRTVYIDEATVCTQSPNLRDGGVFISFFTYEKYTSGTPLVQYM